MNDTAPVTPAVHPQEGLVIIHLALAREVGWEAAGVLWWIDCRSVGSEGWKATYAEVAAEVRLSERTTQRRLGLLVEKGYLTRQRAAWHDATSIWTVTQEGLEVLR